MGQKFCKCFKAGNEEGNGDVYKRNPPSRSTDIDGDHSPPSVAATHGDANGQRDEGKKKKKKKRFWRSRKGRRADETDPNNELERVSTAAEVHQTPAVTEPPVPPGSGSSDGQAPIGFMPEHHESVRIEEINSCQYEIGEELSKGGFGTVYEGTRVCDGLKVAVKFVDKTEKDKYISIPGHPEPLVQELALHILISEGDRVPEIIQLLDWQDHEDRYVMVLESFSPCKDLAMFVKDEGVLDDDLANHIMYQATTAAYMSCKQGVFHRDIKLENLLINTDMLGVKLIDFGCGDLLKDSAYDTFMGTLEYLCPEFEETGEYHGKPATVYSLGLVLFIMVCGDFPCSRDLDSINKKIWFKDGVSNECCSLIQACLQANPKKRIRLENVLKHKWFTLVGSDHNRLDEEMLEDEEQQAIRIEEINSCQYEIGEELGKGAFGTVYEGTRVCDGLKVAVKFVDKTEKDKYISIPGHPEPLVQELALHILISEGDRVPEIIQLLDWQDHEDRYVMVLESFSPCQDLVMFLGDEGVLDDDLANVIMYQATTAAQMSCKRGVFHRDIKLENLLINTDMLDVKLIDFGCGDLLKDSAYDTFMGTLEYLCPEFFETGEYHGKPATVYSLGLVLFIMVCGDFPCSRDLDSINKKIWFKDGVSKECCSLIQACLQANPKKRIRLENVLKHKWFRLKGSDHNRLDEEMLEDEEQQAIRIEEINSCQYEIGEELGKGGFGTVYEGTRVCDGLKVAVKFVDKTEKDKYISIPGHPEPLVQELALHILISEGDRVPEIIQLLDWQDHEDRYVMVLESFSPCQDLVMFLGDAGVLVEDLANHIMYQATTAAYMSCKRGVFHRDIKLENLLINTDMLDVKLIDFGCGDLLKDSAYDTFMGTLEYFCPEFFETGEYHGKPATVYSLGVVLFIMVCGDFPCSRDLDSMNKKIWCKDGVSNECCSLIQACLQANPKKRIRLENVLKHKWFRLKGSDHNRLDEEMLEDEELQAIRIEEINSCQYEIGEELSKGGFGTVYEGTRVCDGLKVAVKFVDKTEKDKYISIPGHPEPLVQELALHILISEGDRVPEIIQLLDWQDHEDRYVMVLESFSPCQDLVMFLGDEGVLVEDLANHIMYQATTAAYMSCKRGVFHRDIKLENLLINTDMLDVKLIDFGCGDLLKDSAYDTFMGTLEYFCPEFFETGEYHGKPATVYSLGVVLFIMVCGDFPCSRDLDSINKKIWCKDGVSKECCSLIQACLQANPKERIRLEDALKHKWFQTTLDRNPVDTLSDADEDELPPASFNLSKRKLVYKESTV